MANYRIHQMNRRLGETLDRLAWFGGSAPSGIAALDAERPAPLHFIRLEGYRRSLTVQEVFDRIRQSAALFLRRPAALLIISGEMGVEIWYGVPWDAAEPLFLAAALPDLRVSEQPLSPRSLSGRWQAGGVLSGDFHAEPGGLDQLLTLLEGQEFLIALFSAPLAAAELEAARAELETEIARYQEIDHVQYSFGSGFGIRSQDRYFPDAALLLDQLRKKRDALTKAGACCRASLLYAAPDRENASILGSMLEGAFHPAEGERAEAVALSFPVFDPANGGFSLPRSPGRPFFDRLAPVFPIDGLGGSFCPPLHYHPGFTVLEPEEAGAIHPFDRYAGSPAGGPAIELGDTAAGFTYRLPVSALARHTFVCGRTRYGKSTTVQAILLSLGLPFLVLETRKKEYRKLCGAIPSLRVYSAGGDALPLRFNPLRPERGVRIGEHISGLMTAFTGAFDLEDPLTGAFTGLLERTYRDFGWELETAAPARLPAGRRYPTVRDLADRIEIFVQEEVHHGPEVRSNIRGALDNRVSQRICSGLCGLVLSGEGSIAETLLSGPAVVELDDLQGEEKALVASLLLTSLNEAIRRREESHDLQNLLVIEEAHTVFRAPSAGVSRAAARVTEQFSDMLAEISAYGTGLLIADQRASAIHPAAIANTSVRIVHNQDEREDVDAIAGALHLQDYRRALLAELKPGQAVIRVAGEHEISRIQVTGRALRIPPPFSEGCAFCTAKTCRRQEAETLLAGISPAELEFFSAGLFHPDPHRAAEASENLARRFGVRGETRFCLQAAMISRCGGRPLYEQRRAIAALAPKGEELL